MYINSIQYNNIIQFLQQMYRIPNCKYSGETIKKICVHKSCKINPFICQTKDCLCDQYHQHDNQPQSLIKWKDLTDKLSKSKIRLIKEDSVDSVQKLKKKFLNSFDMYVQTFGQLKTLPTKKLQQIKKKIQMHQFDSLKGSDLGYLYNRLTNKNYIDHTINQQLKYQITNLQIAVQNFLNQLIKCMNQKLEQINNLKQKFGSLHNNLQLLKNKGNHYMKKGDLNRASDLFQQVLNQKLEDKEVMLNLSMIRIEQQNYQQSLKYLQKLNDNYPQESQIYFLRGKVFAKLSKYSEAIGELTKALEINQKNPKYYSQIAQIYMLYNPSKYSKNAQQNYNKAIQLDKNNSEYYYKRGKMYITLKEYKKGQEDLLKAHKKSSKKNNSKICAQIAQSFLNIKNIGYQNSYIEYYTQAIQIEQKIQYYKARGNMYLQINKPEKALEDFQKVLIKDDKDHAIYALRGKIYTQMQQYQNATDEFTKAISISDLQEYQILRKAVMQKNPFQRARTFSLKDLNVEKSFKKNKII